MIGIARRRFLLAAGTLTLSSSIAWAQQPSRLRRVGFLAQIARPEPIESHFFGSIPRGLRELGYVEGTSFSMDWRFGGGDVSQVPALAAELVKSKPDVISTAGTISAIAMRNATNTIPVVFGNVTDPVGSGLVKSLGRPGTNMTGLASLSNDLSPKLMEILMDAIPGVSRLGMLINPLQVAHLKLLPEIEAIAEKRGLRLVVARASTPAEIESAFAALSREKLGGLIVPLEGLFLQQRRQVADLSARHRIPVASSDNEFAAAGGLFSYGADQRAMFLRMATYIDRILKGTKPEDLPIEQPSTFDFVINAKTARSLGLNISPTLLLRANRVIE